MMLKKEFYKKVEKVLTNISYSKGMSYRSVFEEWVEMFVLNACPSLSEKDAERKDKNYQAISTKYKDKELHEMSLLYLDLLALFQTGQIDDYLGYLYMKCNLGNQSLGQCFTPFHITELTAALTTNEEEWKEKNEITTISDPCCGSGAMSLGYISNLLKAGLSLSKYIFVLEDIDSFACKMAIMQLSMVGANAKVINHNTITEPMNMTEYNTWITYNYFMFLQSKNEIQMAG